LLTRLDEDIAPEHVTIRQGSVKCCKEGTVRLRMLSRQLPQET